jgi:SPP1 family predicted phage head-tail adaptor
MQAGRLRHRIALQRKTAGSPQRTGSGAPDAAWTTVATVSASIEPLRGKEFTDSLAVQSSVSVRIRIRYSSEIAGVDASWRALHGSTVYSIEAVINPDVRNAELQLMCSQGANNG